MLHVVALMIRLLSAPLSAPFVVVLPSVTGLTTDTPIVLSQICKERQMISPI